MTAFDQAFPWMVLILAFCAVMVTIFSGVIMAAGIWFEVNGEFHEKLAPSAAALVLSQVLAVLLLWGCRALLHYSGA